MSIRFLGGPAAHAGPRFFPTALVALALACSAGAAAAYDWIPPRPVTAFLPSATLAAASTHVLQLVAMASGAPASVFWTASFSGNYPAIVTPTSGFLSIPAGGTQTVDFTVTLPDTANGSGFLTVELTHQIGGGRAAKAVGGVHAATLGRPEVKPVPGTFRAMAGTSGSMSYQIHSLIGSAEVVGINASRFNPDANNSGAIFAGAAFDTTANLPAGGTITMAVPTTLAANAYAGNVNSIQLNVSAAGAISVGEGQAIVSAPLPGSLPTALVPVGLVPFDDAIAGRDGSASIPARAYRLIPSGLNGVRVTREVSIDSIGMVDTNGDGVDDRVLGTIRIPAYAAALAVIPGFVTAANETLDVGLLAAGRGGLMLLDLRVLEDPPFGTWEDFFDTDMNGIDDRILRTIPLSGFATDVAWIRAPSGRTVAFVADADSGSIPVSSAYNPASVVPGTGQGVVAIDVDAALDTVGNPPFAAGTLATAGSTLDLEIRGGPTPDLVIADGAGGVPVYRLSISSATPAAVTFTPRGAIPLSAAWGTPHARDLTWLSVSQETTYVAIAASAAGVQIGRVPLGPPPSLVLIQQTLAPAIGVAGAWTGTLGVAEGTSGVALMRCPGAGFLDRIAPAAGPPYTGPVLLARGAPWAATGSALEVASHQSTTSNASALCFESTTGPIPDLLVTDGARVLSLRPGTAPITAVETTDPKAPLPFRVRLSVTPNPMEGGGVFVVRSEWDAAGLAAAGSRAAGTGPALGPVRIEIYDVQGRLVRRLIDGTHGAGASARLQWDGRDQQGRRLSSGRYWARATRLFGTGSATAPVLMLR